MLERRDTTSYDFIKLASNKIYNRLKQVEIFGNAKKIACYYPIGSEVLTQDIMQELLGSGKEIGLPKVVENNLPIGTWHTSPWKGIKVEREDLGNYPQQTHSLS